MKIKSILFALCVMISTVAFAQSQVVAHRGYWKAPGVKVNAQGSAQNSLASYQKADALGIYGSEIDVWISTDGEVFVNHDRVFKGCEIQKSTKAECKKVILDNGEPMPTFKSYLKTVKKGKCKLVIEIKSHKDMARQNACIDKVVALVKKNKLENRVDYIAFSWDACLRLKQITPQGTEIYYLNGDKSPKEVKAADLAGVDYHYDVLRKKHPEWMEEFKSLGLKINVWTVDDIESIQYFIAKGVDFITTNEPELVKHALTCKGHGSEPCEACKNGNHANCPLLKK